MRASRPNEYWHIDVTILKPLDGTKTFLRALIDKYSRKVVAWTLAPPAHIPAALRLPRQAAFCK
jgi:3'-phosphoadenosine 5'-phosphosulfate (PAPS) 3'-phosphatase